MDVKDTRWKSEESQGTSTVLKQIPGEKQNHPRGPNQIMFSRKVNMNRKLNFNRSLNISRKSPAKNKTDVL